MNTRSQNQLTQKINELNKNAMSENKNSLKDFSIGDFLENLIFNKAAAQRLHDEEGVGGGIETVEVSTPDYPHYENLALKEKSFDISDMLPDFSLSEWLSEKTADIDLSSILPDFSLSEWLSEKTADIDLSSILPDFSLSEWLSEKTADIDLNSILPDFSSIGEIIDEQLNAIPERISEIGNSIGEGLSQIPTVASEAFNTISTYANEGLTTIQTAWNELPSFFGGLFSGLGGVATSAGSEIAAGINSGIGTIQSAWESLSSWLSAKISSLSSMASNAVSSIMSFGGGGESKKAEGGFITSPQHILAGEAGTEVIIPLATSRRARAMDLLKKVAAFVGGDSVNITSDKLKETAQISAPKFDELGNISDYNGLKDNFITSDDDLFVQRSKQEAQLKEFWANNSELGEGLSPDEGAVTSSGSNVDNSISGIELGGIQAHFDIGSAENPQEVMQTIRENLGDLADQLSGQIAEKILEIRMNMPLMA